MKNETLKGIIFDGKKDATKVLLEDEDGGEYPSVKQVEHYSIVDGVDGSYLTHLDPENGTGKVIAETMYNWILDIGQESNIVVVGGDSTATNTGWISGAICNLQLGGDAGQQGDVVNLPVAHK